MINKLHKGKKAQYFAEIDKDNKVIRIIVATQELINSGKFGNPKNWMETNEKDTSLGDKFSKNKQKFLKKERPSS